MLRGFQAGEIERLSEEGARFIVRFGQGWRAEHHASTRRQEQMPGIHRNSVHVSVQDDRHRGGGKQPGKSVEAGPQSMKRRLTAASSSVSGRIAMKTAPRPKAVHDDCPLPITLATANVLTNTRSNRLLEHALCTYIS
jgi:hypothetical protein